MLYDNFKFKSRKISENFRDPRALFTGVKVTDSCIGCSTNPITAYNRSKACVKSLQEAVNKGFNRLDNGVTGEELKSIAKMTQTSDDPDCYPEKPSTKNE